jgi:hypothetical protein
MTDIFLSLLIGKELPYNLIIGDKGQSIYIIPRNFENKNLGFNSTWLDLAGLITIHSEVLNKQVTKEGYKVLTELLSTEVSIEESLFNELSKEIIVKFEKQFVIKS